MKVLRALVMVALVLVLGLVGAAVWGWIVMLLFGVLHHEISSSVPPIGFWPAFVIGLVLMAITGGRR